MRKASTILSWLFGVITAAFLLIKGAMGILTTYEGGECMTFQALEFVIKAILFITP